MIKLRFICDEKRHLVCLPYSIDNLHLMAKELNIKSCWFHKDHYDIPLRRIDEITEKCELFSSKQIVTIIKESKSMKIAVGIDVGKNGGIVIIDGNDKIITMATPKVNKDEIDIHQIVKVLSGLQTVEADDSHINKIHIAIEDVHSIFGVGAKANFQFGRALGILEGVVIGLGIPFTKVAPKTWQKEMWMGIKPVEVNTGKKTKEGNIKYKVDTKGTSLLAAKRLYPSLDLRATERSKVAHDGIVDALLIATFVKRKLM